MVTPRLTLSGEAVAVGLPTGRTPERAAASWTLLLDELRAVIKMAAQRGVGILQHGRSHGGQVVVVTQSAADIEALTGQAGLLAGLTDNFAGNVAHRQTAPESRDWLAKLMPESGVAADAPTP